MSEMTTMTSSTRTAAATVSSECGPEHTSSNEEVEGGNMKGYATKLIYKKKTAETKLAFL